MREGAAIAWKMGLRHLVGHHVAIDLQSVRISECRITGSRRFSRHQLSVARSHLQLAACAQPIDICPLQRQAQLGSNKGHITRNLPCPCMPVSCHLRR
jgi:hypothetical protein